MLSPRKLALAVPRIPSSSSRIGKSIGAFERTSGAATVLHLSFSHSTFLSSRGVCFRNPPRMNSKESHPAALDAAAEVSAR